MQGRTQRAAAVGTAAFVLAGSAALALPATATAETKTVKCGSSVTAKPGDKVRGTTPLLGVPLDLGIVSEGTTVLSGAVGDLLGTVCKVTVTVVKTVVEPVPGVGEPAAKALEDTVAGTTNGLSDAANSLSGGGNEPAPRNPPGDGTKPAPENSPGAGRQPAQSGGSPAARSIPAPNSPVLGGGMGLPGFAGLPTNYGTGYAAMRDYSGIPMATAGLFAPSPGVRYGGQIPGYSPEFGILGESAGQHGPDDDAVRNAGQAQALPGTGGTNGGATLPLLLAVLALSGVSAALVRTWVLRKAVG